MTSEYISNRITILNRYRDTLDGIYGEHTSGYSLIVDKYTKILDQTIPYSDMNYYAMIHRSRNSYITFEVLNGEVDLKRIDTISGDESVDARFSWTYDQNYENIDTFYQFSFIPTNPFLFSYSYSSITNTTKGKYLQYNPPIMINNDNIDDISIIGYINLEKRNYYELPHNRVIVAGTNDIQYQDALKISYKAIVEDFLNSVVLNTTGKDISYLNSLETGIVTYGTAINHLYSWIDEEIGALNNTQTVRVNWQARIQNLQQPLTIQDDIAEVLNLKSALTAFEYGGDINFAELEFCFHFADEIDDISKVAEALQIGTRQMITKDELKNKLKLSSLESIMVYGTKNASYTVSTTDSEGNTSLYSVTKTVQVGYCKSSLFGLTNSRFSVALDYCLSFNSEWNKRCEFDKIVGFILMAIGLYSQQAWLVEIGASILFMVIVFLLDIFVMSGRGSEKDKMWARIALLALSIGQGYTDWQSAGTTAGGETVALTNTQILTNLNIGVMSSNALFDVFNTYQKNQWQNDIEDAKAKVEEAQKTLYEMQTEFTNFFYNDFYNMYDSFYNDLYTIK